jgi:hypothetical protein
MGMEAMIDHLFDIAEYGDEYKRIHYVFGREC